MSNPIGRATFDALHVRVRAEIAQGRYRPGARIGIKELATHLRVSPTPLREILSRLVGRGVIEERRSEGYYLARIDGRDLADLYRLHGLCIDLVIDDLALPAVRGAWEEAATPWDLFAALAGLGDNRILAELRRYLYDRLRPIRRCEDALPGDPARETQALQTAVAAGDRTALRALARSFHARRMAAAQDLATLWERHGINQNIFEI